MNQTFLYAIGATVWTIAAGTNVVESWEVQQATIHVTTDVTSVSYVLRKNKTSKSFIEDEVYASLNDALLTLT